MTGELLELEFFLFTPETEAPCYYRSSVGTYIRKRRCLTMDARFRGHDRLEGIGHFLPNGVISLHNSE